MQDDSYLFFDERGQNFFDSTIWPWKRLTLNSANPTFWVKTLAMYTAAGMSLYSLQLRMIKVIQTSLAVAIKEHTGWNLKAALDFKSNLGNAKMLWNLVKKLDAIVRISCFTPSPVGKSFLHSVRLQKSTSLSLSPMTNVITSTCGFAENFDGIWHTTVRCYTSDVVCHMTCSVTMLDISWKPSHSLQKPHFFWS